MTPKPDEALNRLRDRMTRMEEIVRENADSTSQIKSDIAIIKVEVEHLKELFSTRILAMEKSNELQSIKTDQLLNSLSIISAEIDKSPMGRSIMGYFADVNNKIDKHDRDLESITTWQSNADGSLATLKWLASCGVIGLIIALAQIVREIIQ